MPAFPDIVDPERAVQGGQLLERTRLGRVDAPRNLLQFRRHADHHGRNPAYERRQFVRRKVAFFADACPRDCDQRQRMIDLAAAFAQHLFLDGNQRTKIGWAGLEQLGNARQRQSQLLERQDRMQLLDLGVAVDAPAGSSARRVQNAELFVEPQLLQ